MKKFFNRFGWYICSFDDEIDYLYKNYSNCGICCFLNLKKKCPREYIQELFNEFAEVEPEKVSFESERGEGEGEAEAE